MSFLDINGLAIDVELDSLERDYRDIQTFNRSEGLTYEGALYASKREWQFTIPWKAGEAETIAVRDWIKGRGHYWQFQRFDGSTIRFHKYASDGGPGFGSNINPGTARFDPLSTSCPLWSSSVSPNFTTTVTVGFGSEGRYSVSLWKNDWSVPTGASWKLCTLTFDGTTTRFFAPGATLTTAFTNWLTISAVSGNLSVSLLGKNTAGQSSMAFYDKLWIVPYALSTTMIAARAARAATSPFEPIFPFVEMDGDCLEDIFPVTVKGFVDKEDMTQVQSGAPTLARQIKVQLVEK